MSHFKKNLAWKDLIFLFYQLFFFFGQSGCKSGHSTCNQKGYILLIRKVKSYSNNAIQTTPFVNPQVATPKSMDSAKKNSYLDTVTSLFCAGKK
jgi:hypothetical protein